MTNRFPFIHLIIILIAALVVRVLVLLSGSVSFHGDEAIVALMARHILQGDVPIFFYGQHYMGSINAFNTAAGYAIFGESVTSLRVMQVVSYLIAVAIGYYAAWHLSGRRIVAAVAGLSFALSAPFVTIYTATNIGGYTETVIFGNLLLILGYDLTQKHKLSRWRWIALGLVAGVSWWTNGLIIMTAFPVAVLILWTLLRGDVPRGPYLTWIAVALGLFILGGLPWWIDNFINDWAALGVFLPGGSSREFTLMERVIGLFFLGIPTLVGMRYTWLEWYLLPVGFVMIGVYLTATYLLVRSQNPPLKPGARAFVLGVPLTLLIVFILSSFGGDPTGRYLMPLVLPVGIILGTFVEWLRQQSPRLWWLLPVFVFGYTLSGQATAALRNDPGFTTQFAVDTTHISNEWDDELIAWMLENDLTRGYANYWITYRLAFLSGEQIQLAPKLPYHELSLNPGDNRYPAYAEATANAERLAYVNWDIHPELAEHLLTTFAQLDLTYEIHEIGPFTIYYDFQPEAPRLEFDS